MLALVLLSLLLTHSSEVWAGLACLSNPCVHGVCLDDLNSTYFCYCIDGYTGIQCQKNWNDCWSDPCQNGGVCIDGVASFNCSCPPGFIGDLCEEDFNECESNPCQNNGTCQDGLNGYLCNCLPGYSGVHCEIDIAVCNATNETRCLNGGICVEGPGESFSCSCQSGWGDELCQSEIDECLSNPCKNGAVCLDLHADYSCACLFGFTGRNCEDLVKICEKNPCSNGALCLIEDGKSVCYCVPDFHGDMCQFQYDECQIGPKCLNGGTCVDGIDNSTCSCPPGLTGRKCECLILDDNQLDCTYISPKTSTFIPITFTSTTTEEHVPNTTTTIETSSSISTTTTEIISTTNEEAATTTSSLQTTEELLISTTFTTQLTDSETSILTTTAQTESTFSTTSSLPVTTYSPESREPEMTSTTTEESTISYTTTSTTTTDKPEITTHPIDFVTSTELTSTETTDNAYTPLIPLDCTKDPCLNGGTCTFNKETGYHCICPFDTEGSHCEHKLGVRKAAFVGDSYLKHNLLTSNNISIEFDTKTLTSKGLLFYSDLEESYMVLYIEEGHLKFKFSCGYQTMLLSELKIPINTGFLMRVKARLEFSDDLKRCDASIKVNDSLSMTGDQIAMINRFTKPSFWLYLGGVPQDIPSANLPESGFIGCMFNLKISGKKFDIFNDAEDGFGVNECSSLACLSNPCNNGATCHSRGESWICSCKNGFLGEMCEKSVCDDNPCLFGGTCIPFTGSGYICLCPFGKHGHFCENDLKITEPYFSSTIRGWSSFVAYPIPTGITDSMELKFKFTPTTMEQISLLMFIGQKGQHDFYSDHMSVSFVKGYIMLTWNLGSGPRRIFTDQPIEEGARDYTVRIGRIGRRAWLQVDNFVNITGRSPGTLVKLDVAPILYLGGHDSKNFSILPHDLPLHTGFSGCIFDVEIVSGSLIIPLQGSRQAIGRSVGQCGTSECSEKICQNGGICLHHSSTFMCLCQDGWFGPLCTFKQNPCDSTNHKCSSGATCVPVIGDYECDCPIGKTGRYCEINQNITDVHLTGTRSYLALESGEFDKNRFDIEMEIRPLSDNGLLLFMQKSENCFISIILQNGILEFKIFSSKNKIFVYDPVIIASSKILVKGIWYKVQIGVFGRKAYIGVDNVINSAVLPTDNSVDFSKETIFLGGLPDMSLLPQNSISQLPLPYQGCVRYFLLNSLQIPLVKESLIDGRNLNDCDGTPCGKDACLNGGVCWLDTFMKTHCSCTPPFYGNQCELMSDCDETLCKTNGKCEGSKCSCLVGWNGAYCQNKITITTPEFTGRSFLVIKKTGDKKRDLRSVDVKNLYLNFTTVKKDGLLLWSRMTGNSNFIGVGLEKGFLKVAYSLTFEGYNQSFANLPFYSYYKIADGLWHSIEISFSPFAMKLDQNKVLYKGKQRKLFEGNHTLSTDGLFYIGGIPTNSSVLEETNGSFVDNFEGCIEGFATNGEKIIRDFTKFQGRDVGVCKIL